MPNIRPYTSADREACLEIVSLIHPDDVEVEALASRELACSLDEKQWLIPGILVLEESGSVVAFGAYTPSPYDMDGWGLSWIYVHPEFQGKGFGKRMTKALLESIRAKNGASAYVLLTCKAQLIPFYQTCGFRVVMDRGERCLMGQELV